MAKKQKFYDDHTGEEIDYPVIAVRSIRVELSPTEFVWIGTDEVKVFANGENLGKWVQENVQKALDNYEPEDRY